MPSNDAIEILPQDVNGSFLRIRRLRELARDPEAYLAAREERLVRFLEHVLHTDTIHLTPVFEIAGGFDNPSDGLGNFTHVNNGKMYRSFAGYRYGYADDIIRESDLLILANRLQNRLTAANNGSLNHIYEVAGKLAHID